MQNVAARGERVTTEVPVSVAVRGLRKTFGKDIVAVENFDLEVRRGEFVVLLGPSGCGKTTVLRSLAGLERPDAGEIVIGGERVFSSAAGINVPPERRGIGMVFQSYAIWPHMTVSGNIAYPLQMKRKPRAFIASEVDALLSTVSLAGLGGRFATALSGGQQQRVALARALAGNPQAMLFDEPLSNLDAKLRDRMRVELRRLHAERNYTGIYVTHDQAEALALADRIIVMRAGRVEQVGVPAEVYAKPRSRFVADFLGLTNMVPATITGTDGDDAIVSCIFGEARARGARTDWKAGQEVALAVRPSALLVTRDDERTSGASGSVVASVYQGESFLYVVDVGGATVHTYGPPTTRWLEGDRVGLALRPDASLWLLDD